MTATFDLFPRATHSDHIQGLVFAILFSPVAITLMNASFVSVLAATAVGQPLSSSMGILGTMIAGGIIALIAYNSATSPLGIMTLTVWAIVISALDRTDFSPTAALIELPADQINLALSWSLFRGAMILIFTATMLTMMWIHYAGQECEQHEARILASLVPTHHHVRERSIAATASIVMVVLAGVLYVYAAPQDSLGVAWEGLIGMRTGHQPHYVAAMCAGLLLSGVVCLSRWSVVGPLVGVVGLMIVPTYLVLPMWATLTGLVVTPGASWLTAVQLSSPVMMALGMCLLGALMGPIHQRHQLRHELLTMRISAEGV